MTTQQLNKIQVKAEVLTVLSELQTNLERANIDEVLKTLAQQEDKKPILGILVKELSRANEQKAILVCFLLLKLCNELDSGKALEEALWNTLKNPSVQDNIKAIVLNVLKDMGNKVDYENLEEYFENPNEIIDADTQKLLQTAIINPEAQIDFLDFINSLSDNDRKILVESLGEDYSSDALANILNPIVLYNPTSELGQACIEILGETKSQLALHTLTEALNPDSQAPFIEDEVTIALLKKNISKLKISGIREDNAIEFYKSLLQSKPYCSYTSYPDGHGNQAIIFSREREDDTIQMVALVINDSYGLIDCFGFNEISKQEFEKIVDRFYGKDEHIYLNPSVIKAILMGADKLTRKTGGKISYEYICWKTLFADIEAEPVPIELTMQSQFVQMPIIDSEMEQIYMLDFVQRWFFDTEYSEEFKTLASGLNIQISEGVEIDFESVVQENWSKIFTDNQKSFLDKRILMSAYLKYLSGDIEEAQLLYSLYYDEENKTKLQQTILRKSIYEYYVLLKFKAKEENKMTNIFSMKNKQKTSELTAQQIESTIAAIEKVWVG